MGGSFRDHTSRLCSTDDNRGPAGRSGATRQRLSVVLGIALAGLLVLAGCSDPIGTDELENRVTSALEKKIDQSPESVECPDELPAEVDETTRCTVTVDDGQEHDVTVKATDTDSDQVKLAVELDDGLKKMAARSYADPPTELTEPQEGTDGYGIEITAEDFNGNTDDDAPHVVVYEDYQCPHCQSFEQASGDHLMDLAEDGEIILEYRELVFLDQASDTEYSSRAANAAVCVLESADIARYSKMHHQLFVDQPDEGGKGMTDNELNAFAEDAGADDAKTCIKERTYDPWLREATDAAGDNEVEATPTVRVDGTDVEGQTPDDLDKAIDAAKH